MSTPTPLGPGMRQTRQRRLVWDAVQRLGGHCTAEQIAAAVAATEPGLARSTVYRALDALASAGALHAVRLGEGPVHYEIAGEEHQHAICQVCDAVFHIEHDLVRELEEHLQQHHRFRPVRTEVLVVGVCDSCARGRPPRSGGRRAGTHVHFASE